VSQSFKLVVKATLPTSLRSRNQIIQDGRPNGSVPPLLVSDYHIFEEGIAKALTSVKVLEGNAVSNAESKGSPWS
jgi:hypothetical protein